MVDAVEEGAPEATPKPGRVLLWTGAALGVMAILLASIDIARLESHERDTFSVARIATDEGVLLARALDAGDWVRFEVCADRPFDARWESLAFSVVREDTSELVFERRLDPETRERAHEGRHGHCLVLGQSSEHGLPESGTYALATRWEVPPVAGAAEARIAGRLVTRRPLTWASRSAPLLGLVAVMLLVVGALRSRRPTPPARELPSKPLLRAACAVSALAAAIVVIPLITPSTSFAVFARGLFFISLELFLVVRFWPRARLLELRNAGQPLTGWLVLAGGPVIGFVLVILGRFVGAWVPVPEVAPIHDFVSLPSGTVAAAVVGMLAPVAEEWFFRGFLFGLVATRTSNAVAWVATTLAFAVVHLPQHWGAWDAFAALTVTGMGLGALRWWTGSFATSAAAHLTHNALLILPRLFP